MVKDEELQSRLARIRKTVADANSLISQVELRIAETDRMLERQGLTREQVLAMRFSEAQLEAVNDELRRRGMEPLERFDDLEAPSAEAYIPDAGGCDDVDLENRQRKFGMMMKPFQI